MFIDTTVDRHEPEDPTIDMDTRPQILLAVRDAKVIGKHPFFEKEHQLKLTLGMQHTLWHDGDEWRISNGWGPRYAARVLRWPAIEDLDTKSDYVIQVPLRSDESATVVPANGDLR